MPERPITTATPTRLFSTKYGNRVMPNRFNIPVKTDIYPTYSAFCIAYNWDFDKLKIKLIHIQAKLIIKTLLIGMLVLKITAKSKNDINIDPKVNTPTEIIEMAIYPVELTWFALVLSLVAKH